MSGLFTCGPIAVVDAGSDVAQAVVTRLGGAGLVVDSAANVPAGCRAAIYLGGLRPFNSAEESARVNYEAFDIARALAGGSEPPKLFVTVHDSGRDFGAWAAGLSGIAKTFACECPEAGVKTIDLHRGLRPPSAIADAIVAELLMGGSQIEVRLTQGGAREVPILDPVVIKESVDWIGSDSFVVASGGGRGITAACLIELARTARPRIAILGRTVLGDEPADCGDAIDEAELKRVLSRRAGVSPNLREISREAAGILAAREIRSTMRSIERAGSACAYFSADMRDPAAVWRAVASARERFGLVTAIIHGAGAIADRKIADKTSGQFALVFETKVVGLRALLAATETDPIDTICLFSSVAARFGNPGQCDYAAANEALNRVAVAEAGRRNPRCMVRSIAWGPWDGGMVTAPVAAHFRSRGAGLIAMASGARAFVRELKNPTGPVEVLISANGDRFSESNSRTEWSSEILVNRTTYPFLDSHRIKDYAVVPLVLVNEWFHRFAESCRPGMQVAACRDLRVLRGIPLPAFEAEGHLLRINARIAGEDKLACELRSPDDALYYSASLDLSIFRERDETWPDLGASSEIRLVSDLYGAGRGLFHGPDFQVIEELSSLDESSAAGVVRSTRGMRWPSGPWRTDAAALDGALQLIRLWGERNSGRSSLPTRVGAFVRRNFTMAGGSLRCRVRCRQTGAFSIVADADLLSGDGRTWAEMRDVEMHPTPGTW